MNTQEAIETAQDLIKRWGGMLRPDYLEAIETLLKAVEWQPMVTCPLRKEVILLSKKGHVVVGRVRETASYNPWLYVEPSCNGDDYVGDVHGDQVTFAARDFTGWKEVE